jgi:protein-S-isoprenylcysteine O-methyltransferase Ste14
MGEGGPRKLGLREDWASAPFLLITSVGFLVLVYDFWILQGLSLRLSASLMVGILMVAFGGYFRITSRRALMGAGFGLLNSAHLQIVEGHRLVTDGVYSRIRHPLYLGEITRNLGFTLILSSMYGFALVLAGGLFLPFRMEIEERMLLEKFGQEYEEYMKRTKRDPVRILIVSGVSRNVCVE